MANLFRILFLIVSFQILNTSCGKIEIVESSEEEETSIADLKSTISSASKSAKSVLEGNWQTCNLDLTNEGGGSVLIGYKFNGTLKTYFKYYYNNNSCADQPFKEEEFLYTFDTELLGSSEVEPLAGMTVIGLNFSLKGKTITYTEQSELDKVNETISQEEDKYVLNEPKYIAFQNYPTFFSSAHYDEYNICISVDSEKEVGGSTEVRDGTTTEKRRIIAKTPCITKELSPNKNAFLTSIQGAWKTCLDDGLESLFTGLSISASRVIKVETRYDNTACSGTVLSNEQFLYNVILREDSETGVEQNPMVSAEITGTDFLLLSSEHVFNSTDIVLVKNAEVYLGFNDWVAGLTKSYTPSEDSIVFDRLELTLDGDLCLGAGSTAEIDASTKEKRYDQKGLCLQSFSAP